MYLIKQIRCCNIMLNSPATRLYQDSTSSFSIQPFCITAFWYQLFIYIDIYSLYLTSINYFYWIVLVCIHRYAFRHILVFYPPFLYLGDEHVSHKWNVFAILFFYVLPRASYGYIWSGFIPSVVWRFSNYFSSSLGVGI